LTINGGMNLRRLAQFGVRHKNTIHHEARGSLIAIEEELLQRAEQKNAVPLSIHEAIATKPPHVNGYDFGGCLKNSSTLIELSFVES